MAKELHPAVLPGTVKVKPLLPSIPKVHCRQSTLPRRSLSKPRFVCGSTTITQSQPQPAILPGTVKDFPIKQEELIAKAKQILYEDELGKNDESVLADDFRFEFPIVKLDKKDYLKAIRSFNFKEGFPNYAQNAYDWRVDAYEPQRVWCTIRVTGTHSGTLKIFGKYEYKPTGINVYGAPEAFSITFNEQGKATSFTGGYVMDNRLGNTNKLGALFGLLAGIGVFVPHPQPGTLGWKVGVAVDTGVNLISSSFHFFTLGLFKSKPKIE